jgi:hypothetical protein
MGGGGPARQHLGTPASRTFDLDAAVRVRGAADPGGEPEDRPRLADNPAARCGVWGDRSRPRRPVDVQSVTGWEFQAITPVPALGISAWYAWTFVVGHSVWSIAVPIALVELLFPDRARTPWLGRAGLPLAAAAYLAGCFLIGKFVYGSERFLASPGQLAGAAGVGLVLVALAFTCGQSPHPLGTGGCLGRFF